MPGTARILEGYAHDEWYRVADQLWQIGLLRVTDTAALSAYRVSYARWRTAEEVLVRMAQNDDEMHGLTLKFQSAPSFCLGSCTPP